MIKHPTLGNIDLYDNEIKKLICCFLSGYSLQMIGRKMYNWTTYNIFLAVEELGLINLPFDKEWAEKASNYLYYWNVDKPVCG